MPAHPSLGNGALRSFLKLAGGAVWTCDPAGRIVAADGPGLECFGADAAGGREFASLWEEPQTIRTWLADCLQERPCLLTVRRGERTWELRAEPLAGAGAERWGMVVGADVTARERSLEEARRNEARLRLLTENLPAIVWRVDHDLRFVEVRGAGVAKLGRRAPRVGSTVAEFLGRTDAAGLPFDELRHALAGEEVSFDFSFGGRTWLVRIEPLPDGEGRIEGAVGLAFDITEQKEAEREARAGRIQIEAVLESVRDPVWWVDTAGKLILANSAFQAGVRDALGRELQPGEDPVDAYRDYPELAHRWRDLYARAMSGEVVHEQQERRGHGRSGSYWVSLFPVEIEGEKLGVCCCAKDLTDVVRMRGELRQAEERFSQLFDTCPLPIMVTRQDDGAVLAANRAAEKFYGIRRDEVAGRTTLDLGLWVDPAEREKLVKEVAAKGEVSDFEARYRGPRGDVRETLLSCTTANLDGVPCLIALSEDVTDRRRYTAELEQSQERYHRLFAACPLPIFVTRMKDGAVMDLNRQAEEEVGWRRGEILGRTSQDLGWWPEPALREELFRRLAKEGVVHGFPSSARLRDGRVREVQLSAAVTRIGGEPCVVTLVDDVTEKRRLEQQLRQAAKMEALGRFAGGMAHDFNNLLAVIAGQAHLLRRHLGQGHPELATVGRIEASVQRAARLTGQLLTFGRTQVLQPEPHDVNAIVRDCAQMIERVIGKDVELTTSLTGRAAWSVVDRGQLEQVVMNLAVNARDAMPRGGRLVIGTDVVEVRPQDRATSVPPGDYVLVAVTDTGTGMDERTKSRLFEPFFTTKPQGKGTGLGLAMVYGLVRQSGGHVLVDTAPGKGTTFQLFLPRTEPPAVKAPSRRPERGAPEGRPALSVLLVDDEPDVRAILEEMLIEQGHRVLVAASGDEALHLARQAKEPIDVLVTDLMMPRMHGAELARRLRAERPGLRVLFISGYPGEAAGQLPPLDASTAFLQKPFPEEVLDERLRSLVERRTEAEARAP